MQFIIRFFVPMLILAGCASEPATRAQAGNDYIATMDQAFARLTAHIDGCSDAHGGDPRTATDLGPYELAPNERTWLTCVYDGVAKHMLAASRNPKAYQRIIDEHRKMTDMIVREDMDRAGRASRMEQLKAEIKAMEAETGALNAAAQRHQTQMMDNTINAMRGATMMRF